jgi:phosphoglycolate phosphatase
MSLRSPADGAIFDFDGVVIDSLPPVETAINGALREHGFAPRPAREIARFIGPPTLSAFAELTGAAEGSETVAAVVETYHERYEEVYLEQTMLVEGITAVLDGLHVPRALATSKELRFVAPLLGRFGLHFDAVSAPELSEPKSITVARAREALGARDPVMVGDRFYDIEAARANDLRVIAVTWGIGDREELDGADLIVDTPAQLSELLR